jgi:hypothetical protein
MVKASNNIQRGKEEPQQHAVPNPWHEMAVLSVLAALAALAVGMMIVSAIRLAWVLA